MSLITEDVAKIYEKHWTQANGDALVWANALDKTVDGSNETACFSVNFPHEFLVKKFILVVAAGSVDSGSSGTPDITATFYNLPPCNLSPAEAKGEATGVLESASITSNANYHLGKASDVIDSKSAHAINGYESIQWFAPTNAAGGLGANTHNQAIYFRNMEGTQTNPKRRLYLLIWARNPSSDLVLEMAIGGEPCLDD